MIHRWRFDEAATIARRALELDPLSPDTLQWVATQLLYSGHTDEPIDLYKKVVEMDPEAAFAQGNLGLAYVRKGMLDEGLALIRESTRKRKTFSPTKASDLAYALGKAGRFDELTGLLAETLDWHEKNHRGATALASIHANLGERDKAFDWLDKAYEEHSGYLALVFTDFAFDTLHSDPRWDAMKRRLGLG
jgi:adenylate cyclase